MAFFENKWTGLNKVCIIKSGGAVMNKNKTKMSSQSAKSKTRRKTLNSYGYDVSDFNVLDIPVRRDPSTGRLISTHKPQSKKNI